MQLFTQHLPLQLRTYFIFFLLLWSFTATGWAQEDILEKLKRTVEQSSQFDRIKISKIKSLQKELDNIPASSLVDKYKYNSQLLQEYKLFNQDSAFSYAQKARSIAIQLDSISLISSAVIDLADITVSAGMYKETLDLLNQIDPTQLPQNQSSLYYGLLGRVYSEMAEYSSLTPYSSHYENLASQFRLEALELTETGTFFHSFLEAFIHYQEGEIAMALQEFKELKNRELLPREEALVHYLLGDIYENTNNYSKAIENFAKAAILDVKTATKETLAIIRLSELLFRMNDLQNASYFIQKANRDAAFYGAQHRKIQVGAILPLIEEKVITRIEEQKQRLSRQNILLGILLLFVLSLAVVIYLQVRRLKAARKDILRAHENLQQVNRQIRLVNQEIQTKNNELKKLNDKLLEANKIKEEYIGFFFSRDADLFEKFREFKTKLEEDLKNENIKKAKYTIGNYDLKREKEKLLKNFDEAFIKLFPNFIEEFNDLLKEEEQIKLKRGQILNKELRIFALMRLGINHNEIIAQILGYSVNSIYTYKTKIRKKSILEKREFDEKLMKNTTLKL